MWLVGQVGGASAAAWTHVPHHVSWCGPSLHVSHFPNQIQSSNCCPALLPALVERHTWRVFSTRHYVFVLGWRQREYWMIYRGPGFLSIVWFCSSHVPPPSPASKLSLFLRLPGCCRSSLLTGEGGTGGPVKSQIIRRRECLVLYKSFNTLCSNQSVKYNPQLG